LIGLICYFMTAQLPDKVLLNGVHQNLYTNPLEHYWIRTDKRRPVFYPLPDCRRGYVATWEIKDGQLYLKDIDGNYEKTTFFFGKKSARYSLKILFPKSGNRLVKANWFSGKLRVPQGKMTLYDEDYGSRFEQEVIITIEKGNIVKMVTVDYTRKVLIVNAPIKKRTRV
jgi:hypothetical protein